jgi:hypothetical protein
MARRKHGRELDDPPLDYRDRYVHPFCRINDILQRRQRVVGGQSAEARVQ